MLFGQRVEIFTDHINPTRADLEMTSNRVYRWRLVIEEYGPAIMYTKGTDNTVADTTSRLDYNPTQDRHADDEEMSTTVKKIGITSSRYSITMTLSQVTFQMKTKSIIIVKHLQIT